MTGPRFGIPHLSEDAVAAFADGVLSSAATARARKHCGECAECADAVRGQREAAMMLRSASAPSLPAGLLDRLAGLPMSAPLPPPMSGLPTTVNADGVEVFVAYRPPVPERDQPDEPGKGEQQSRAQTHRRGVLPMTILASAAAVVAAGAFGGQVSDTALDQTAPNTASVNFSSVTVPPMLASGTTIGARAVLHPAVLTVPVAAGDLHRPMP